MVTDIATIPDPVSARDEVALAIITQVRADHGLPPCALSDVDDSSPYLRQADRVLASLSPAQPEVERITREQYPEIVQAARWMDDDNGTPHFAPGIGFIVDDPDGLTVPARWLPHLDAIEQALAGLDHANPHPLDIDTIEWLEGKQPTIHESAAYCFVCGEHTPVTIMATSSEALFIANRFFNERYEGWQFDPSAGFAAPTATHDAEALREEMPALVEWIVELARNDIRRTQTDFIGRMHQAMGTFESVCDEYPDGEWPESARDEAGEALAGLAGLALAQLAMVSDRDNPLSALDSAQVAT